MKRLLIIVLFFTIFNSAFSQTISPVQTGEFCPNTEYTFTATITKPYQSIIGMYSASVTQQVLSVVHLHLRVDLVMQIKNKLLEFIIQTIHFLILNLRK